MTFADKIRYDTTFQQVTHKGGESYINYIKRFHNVQDLSVSVRNSYSEDQIMHTFLDNFHQSGKYSDQLASHQRELRREEKFPDQKYLNISYFQTDYFNLDNSVSGSSRHYEGAHSVQTKCTFCGLNNRSAEKCFKRTRQEKKKAHAVGVSSKRNSERRPRKCYRCGSEDHIIEKCPKPPKDNEKRRKQVRFNEKVNRGCDNCEDYNDHKIYASMARMSNDEEREIKEYGDSSQLTNWVLDSRATCHMTPEVTDFIPELLEDTDYSLKLRTDIMSRQNKKVSVCIQMCDYNGKKFIANLYNVLLAPDICDRLFSIIMLINAGHTCLFHKGLCTVYFGAKEDNAVTLPHSAQRKYAFTGEIQDVSKKNKYPARKKIALEFLHQRLGHRSTRSLLARDTANVWEDVELRIDPDLFCTSCQIFYMNKKARSKIPLKPKAPFKWVFIYIIPSTSPKILTSDTTFSN